jgi:triphosphoribosyl-dephospho-CoA synthase
MQTRMDNVAHGLQRSMRLASLAREALIAEAELTPKPALVDWRGSGAHHDLSLALMRQSATAIEPYFAAMASCSQGHNVDGNLRSQLASIGRSAERAMYQATQGSNAHKGAIWILGLLVSAAIRVPGENAREIVAVAGAIARLPDREQPKLLTHGDMVRHRYGAGGARMEASTNFPHVMRCGLPMLRNRRAKNYPEEICRLDALLSLMAELDDTCVLYRGGVEALRVVKAGAQAALDAGGYANANGRQRLHALDRELIARNVSPGGSADLLAATIFLDALEFLGTDALPLVIPRTCDFLDLSVLLHTQPDVFNPPQSRHPERSASQIYRIPLDLWRGVEGPR